MMMMRAQEKHLSLCCAPSHLLSFLVEKCVPSTEKKEFFLQGMLISHPPPSSFLVTLDYRLFVTDDELKLFSLNESFLCVRQYVCECVAAKSFFLWLEPTLFTPFFFRSLSLQ
jgi:hypothetical protein